MIFIKNLPLKITEAEVRAIYEVYGTIYSLNIRQKPAWGSSTAVVAFESKGPGKEDPTIKDVALAVLDTNGKQIPVGNPLCLVVMRYGERQQRHETRGGFQGRGRGRGTFHHRGGYNRGGAMHLA